MTLPDLRESLRVRLDADLAQADALLAARYPGAPTDRHPVHTVYLPGDRCTAEAVTSWGPTALDLLERFAPTPGALAAATGRPGDQVEAVYERLRTKLRDEPIEDLRADFEDGYGVRPDEVEDAHVRSVGDAFATLRADGALPTWHGVRFKSFEAATRARGVATLVEHLRLAHETGILDGEIVTLPKVTSVDQVAAMVTACDAIEAEFGLAAGTLTFEIQVETAQAILSPAGVATVAPMVHAAGSRLTGLVYGTYDYSAGLGIAAAYQALDHPAADHAKAVMQVATAQTGARICDGSTNVVAFTDTSAAASTWALHVGLVHRALVRGIYQGWDMHPGHLVSRYLANFLFFRQVQPDASRRLAAYLDRSAGGDVMDEPATAKMLASALLRGVHCGALDEAEVESSCGVGVTALGSLAAPPTSSFGS